MFQPPLPLFQTYLLPTLSFRRYRNRRKSSSTSTTSTTTTTSDDTYPNPITTTSSTLPTSPPPPTSTLTGHTATISCSRCHAHLALTTQIISKGFTGRHGRAYLLTPLPHSPHTPLSNYPLLRPAPPGITSALLTSALPNTHTHRPTPRHLVTGMHTVCDVSCAVCGSVVGWKYVGAEEESQRYKVGKFILESRRTSVGACWENEVDGGAEWGEVVVEEGEEGKGGEVVFDSEDEEECEDLFAGVWTPALARRRRAKKGALRKE